MTKRMPPPELEAVLVRVTAKGQEVRLSFEAAESPATGAGAVWRCRETLAIHPLERTRFASNELSDAELADLGRLLVEHLRASTGASFESSTSLPLPETPEARRSALREVGRIAFEGTMSEGNGPPEPLTIRIDPPVPHAKHFACVVDAPALGIVERTFFGRDAAEARTMAEALVAKLTASKTLVRSDGRPFTIRTPKALEVT